MKLSSVKSSNVQQDRTLNNSKNSNYKRNNSNNNVNFTGFTEVLMSLDNAMKNSRAIQFTVEDMTGTNIPRTLVGAFGSYKYEKKINIPALLQEASREFLTGPLMCLVPLGIISASKKIFGKTSNTHIENINSFSYIMSLVKNNGTDAEIADDFYKKVSKDMLQRTVGKTVNDSDGLIANLKSSDVDEMAKSFALYSQSVKNVAGKKGAEAKTAKQGMKAALENVQATFESIVKRTKDVYDQPDFLTATYTVGVKENSDWKGSTDITNFAKYANAYLEDFTKAFSKDGQIKFTQNQLNNFKGSWIGKRSVIATSMFLLAGFVMSFIPKFYTFLSGPVNPNARAIYNEASKVNKTNAGGDK